MIKLHRYQLIFDPFVIEGQTVDWSKVVSKLAGILLKPTSRGAIFEASNALVGSITAKGRMLGALGEQMHGALKKAIPDFVAGDDQMLASVVGMLAALHLLNNGRLKGGNAAKREAMAIALWPALSFQESLLEPRLEELTKDILDASQRVALEMAARLRQRREDVVQSGAGPVGPDGRRSVATTQTIEALKWNSILDQEEIDLLRWTLADESRLLERPFGDMKGLETLVVARGLELGRLLRRFPTFEHYVFVSQICSGGRPLGLQALLDALGKDRNRLAGVYRDDPIVRACPVVFPFLTALNGGYVGRRWVDVRRPLADWCGRALLESAAVNFANETWSRI